jgi:hypothetical protein
VLFAAVAKPAVADDCVLRQFGEDVIDLFGVGFLRTEDGGHAFAHDLDKRTLTVFPRVLAIIAVSLANVEGHHGESGHDRALEAQSQRQLQLARSSQTDVVEDR